MYLCPVLGGQMSRSGSVHPWEYAGRVSLLLEEVDRCRGYMTRGQIAGTTDTEMGRENRYRRDRGRTESDRHTDKLRRF